MSRTTRNTRLFRQPRDNYDKAWVRRALGLTIYDLNCTSRELPKIDFSKYLIPEVRNWHGIMEHIDVFRRK